MKRVNTSPISGMQELLPPKQATFDSLKRKIQDTYHAHGFMNIETPMLERTEILFAKAGGDTEKQIYKVLKTGEIKKTAEEADQALRFDHTVPLARYVVEHESDLSFPFRAAQIGENFRGERPQKGRFREFYQCDIDIIGRNSLPIFYDAEVINTLLSAFASFNLKTDVIVRISNRKILSGLLFALNLEEKARDIYSIIDHSEKVPSEKTEEALTEIGLSKGNKDKLLKFMNISATDSKALNKLKSLGVTNELFETGLSELEEVINGLLAYGHKGSFTIDMRIVRGLDYYTGTVYEFCLPSHMEVGSIGGGGRYENLAEYFTEQKFPGVGGSIGLNRLFYVLSEHNLLPEDIKVPIDYAIIIMNEIKKEPEKPRKTDMNNLKYAEEVAEELRHNGESVAIIPEGSKKMADILKYASKIAKNAIIIGENEVKSGSFETKTFL